MAQSEALARAQPGQRQGSAEDQILLPRRHKSTGGVAAVLFSVRRWVHTHNNPEHPMGRPMSSSEVLNAERTAGSDEMPGWAPLGECARIAVLTSAGALS